MPIVLPAGATRRRVVGREVQYLAVIVILPDMVYLMHFAQAFQAINCKSVMLSMMFFMYTLLNRTPHTFSNASA